MKTASKRVRGLGSARGGTDDFWRQRLTAVINIPLVIGFVWLVACLAGGDHATVAAGLSRPLPALLMIAVVAVAAIHMRIGMQEIIEDYAHHEGAKFVLLIGNTIFSFGVALIAIFAILKLAFGA